MKIDLNQNEVGELLRQKVGLNNVSFRVFYTEPDEVYEARTGNKIAEMKEPPIKDVYCLYF